MDVLAFISELSIVFPIMVLMLICPLSYISHEKRWATPIYLCALIAFAVAGVELFLTFSPPPAQPLYDPALEKIGKFVPTVPVTDPWDAVNRFFMLLGSAVSVLVGLTLIATAINRSRKNRLRRKAHQAHRQWPSQTHPWRI